MLAKYTAALICSFILSVVAEECQIVSKDGSSAERAKQLLSRLDPLKRKTFVVSRNQAKSTYSYYLSICSTPSTDTISKCDQNKENAGVFESTTSGCSIIGKINEAEVYGGDHWIMLIYRYGDNYTVCNKGTNQSRIMITCNPNEHGETLEFIEESNEMENHYYLFELHTNILCAKSKLSGGSIFSIIFFTVLGVYLLFGSLYRRLVIGAKGLEQIPNYSFWKDFGKLQAEGCDFLCRCGDRQEAKMYRGIGENEEGGRGGRDDRDDHLLPM